MRANKAVALFIAFIIFLAVIFSGCSKKATESKDSKTGLGGGDNLLSAISDIDLQKGEDRAFECAQQDFSFRYDSAYTAEWNDRTGVTVYTEEQGALPYMQIFRSTEGHAGFDAKAHFAAVLSQTTKEYGDKLIAKTEYEYYTVSGKNLEGGISIKYKSGKDVVEMLIVTELTQDSVVQYVCRYYEGQGDATLKALEKAVDSYRPGAYYYSEGGKKADGEDKIDGGGKGDDGKGDAGGQGDGGGQGDAGDQGNQNKLQAKQINLAKYDGGFFTVMLPEGWQIQIMGQFTTFGFRAWDPKNPDYEIFYYGNLSPLNKSYDSKYAWKSYVSTGGFANASVNADAPVIDQYAASSVFYEFSTLKALSDKYGFGFSLPVLENFTLMEIIPIETQFAQASTSEEMVLAGLKGTNGGICAGKFMASISKTMSYYVGYADMTPTSAMNVTGVIAPKEDFLDVEVVLTESVFSLRFTGEYIKDGIAYSKNVGENAMADNAARQEVFDEANRKWREYFRGEPDIGDIIDKLDDIFD